MSQTERVLAAARVMRRCPVCGAALTRRDGEGSKNFRTRRTCGRACGARMRNPGPDYFIEDRGHATPCWIWQKVLNDQGYALLSHKRVHRVFYERSVGPIPAGYQLDHLCRVRACVNPAHMEPVTNAENTRRGARAVLSHAAVAEIRASCLPLRELMRRYGAGESTICAAKSGESWS